MDDPAGSYHAYPEATLGARPLNQMARLPAELVFLDADGEMAEHIRQHDWEATPLGAPANWSPSLKAMVRMSLTTRHPIFIFWGSDHICLYNDAYSASLGTEKHPSILGQKGEDAWPEIWPLIGPQIEIVLKGEGATWHENQLVPILRHGAIQEAYWTYSYGPIDDARAPGGVGGVMVICTETTAQVMAEQRTATERENFAQLFDQSPSFMTLLRGPKHVVELANPAYMRLVGYRDVLGRTVEEALPEAVTQGFVKLLDDVYATGKAFAAHGLKFVMQQHGDDTRLERYVDFVYQPIVDASGAVTGIFVEGVDVSERLKSDEELRRLATRLQEQDERKTEFLATLAHELRNPLAPLRNGVESLRRGMGAEAASATYEMLARQLSQMVHLVDDLMDASRISSGKFRLTREHLDLRTVLKSAVEISQPLIDAKRHRLTISLCEEPLPAEIDRVRMAQVVSNLLNNAAKYTPDGGCIQLAAWRKGRAAVVSVTDDGIGIAADLLDSVFDMFVQIPEMRFSSDSGLGIGLTLVRRLTELHGGSVSATRREDKGSVFTLEIPLAGEQDGAPTAAMTLHPPLAKNGLRVLVVDDNVDAASSMCDLIALIGHEARAAHNGDDALAIARRFRPDIVFLDLGMPIKDGYVVVRELRATQECASAIVVALTGWGSPADLARTAAAGFDAHLTKPADAADIEGILNRMGALMDRHEQAGRNPAR